MNGYLKFGLLCLLWLPALRAEEAETPENPVPLIQQLGAESYEQREQATQQLQQIGLPARAALLEGLKDDDPEVRRRCRKILRSILQADFRQRLEEFRNHDQGGFGLPKWDVFRDVVGSGPKARELFLKMQQSESGLLASAEIGGKEAAQALKLRLAQAYSTRFFKGRRQEPSVGTVSALLLVWADPKLALPKELRQIQSWQQLVQTSKFSQAVEKGDLKIPLRKLLSVWIEKPQTDSLAYQKLRIAMKLKLKAGLRLAQAMLEDRQQRAQYRVYALATVAILGGKPYAKILADVLDDDTEVRKQNNRTIQVNDAALAWLVHLTGQKVKDYSQPTAKKLFDLLKRYKNRYGGFNYNYFGYENDKQRQQALEKWSAWVKENPLPDLPEDFVR